MAKQTKLIMVVAIMIFIASPASLVFGVEPPPDNDEKIVGPTLWAVGVIDCTTATFATIRVKKVADCNVDTDPQSLTGLQACPTSSEQILYQRLQTGSVFGMCNEGEPIVTKVKNFKVDGTLVSFDAQINFVVSDDFVGDTCE